jgi:hypothetical protein
MALCGALVAIRTRTDMPGKSRPSGFGFQPLQGRPLLARGLDVLSIVLADGASGGRLVILRILGPAGRADEVRHVSRLRPHGIAFASRSM